MSRRSRILFRIFAGLLLTTALLLILIHMIILPAIVRQQFRGVLHSAGIDNATFHVPFATLGGARITDIQLPGGNDSIEQIIVNYGVGGLRRGQVDSLS